MIGGLAHNLGRLRALDTETLKIVPGRAVPRLVCASTARLEGGAVRGDLVVGRERAIDLARQILDGDCVLVGANVAYDLAVLAEEDRSLFPLIFRALREGRVYDILIAEGLNAIYYGHLGKNPDGSDLVKPSTGEWTNRYSLEVVHKLLTGKCDAKKNDVWRTSYALLEGVPEDRWPAEARVYPVDDAANTIEDALFQIFGRPGAHEWVELPAPPPPPPPPGVPALPAADPPRTQTSCRLCGAELTFAEPSSPECPRAPREPHKNLDNLSAQIEADFALKLGAAHSLRTDPDKVAALEAEVEEKHRRAVERFQKKGWIRPDGTEDQAAVKRAIARAYGATGTCRRCGGGAACPACSGGALPGCGKCGGSGILVGKVRESEPAECRGPKERGRYRGCQGRACGSCGGRGWIEKLGNPKTCKNVFDENDVLVEEGCDGTGLDLSTAPLLPRSDKYGVKTDRDTCMESGDEDLSDYGENEFEKSRTTYLPYLRTGIHRPLSISPNVLLTSGRVSYEGCPVHQFPRDGGERECIRARGRWCGYPVEMVLGSTDYSAGELCACAQYTYWLFGYSAMRDAINASGDPGILHSELAAQVLGISLREQLERQAVKDKVATLTRQSVKCINFGKPAAMGSATIVLTNRKKNAGFTVCEGGPARNRRGEPGYWGIRFCITIGGRTSCGDEKVTEWKGVKTPPVCRACCEVVEYILTPAYYKRFPEIVDYHKWGKRMIKERRPVPSLVWDEEAQQPRVVRERGFIAWDRELSALLNNGFQSMLADIGKHAYVQGTRECVGDDGPPSPLAGCRMPLFLHDEPLSELVLDGAHLSGPRIAEIMVASGRKLAPDVVWRAETAIAFWWNKSMEPVYVEEGGQKKLVPWGPIPDYLQDRFQRVAA